MMAFNHPTGSIFEPLEPRRLMAGDSSVVQSLPFVLDFDRPRAGVVDRDGQGTGVTWVQTNRLGNEYQPSLIDLRTGAGVLNITSSGSAAAGTNHGDDNTLTNGLQVQFDARTGAFTVTARLKGPLSQLDAPVEQAGIMFGPDQENFVKLVALAGSDGPVIQFIDEQKIASGYRRDLEAQSTFALPAFSGIQALDLSLSADPVTRTVTASYRINGGSVQQLPTQLTLDADKGGAFFSAAARAGLIVAHKNDVRPVTVSFDRFEIVRGEPALTRPVVTGSRPSNAQTGIRRDAFVAADVFLPNPGQGVDPATLTSANVKLYRTSDGAVVSTNANTSGGGDSIVLQPRVLLDANTSYTFEVTSGVKDISGASFQPYKSTFTTGSAVGSGDDSIAFTRVPQANATKQSYSGVTMGPDGKLYATTLTGHILRYAIASDGTLGAPEVVSTVRTANGNAPRFITGLAFDPASTASKLIAWVTHGEGVFEDATDWTGKVSRLTGPNLQNYDDAIVNLPRSVRDHLTNQLAFGPNGKLFLSQGSNTAMGAPDNAWGMRREHLLNAAVLVADTKGLVRMIESGVGPLDAKTVDAGGTYDPLDPDAKKPLVIWATGIRNAYDLVWHSNGQLYVPANGSAAGGNTPSAPKTKTSSRRIDYATRGDYTKTPVPAIEGVAQAQPDYLYRVEYGGYYGHPNPSRNEFVLNGGNPTDKRDADEVLSYPVGTRPDRNFRGAAYNFGPSYAPSGVIEYKSDAFGGKLKGNLLVARYSGGDDVVALGVNGDGSIKGLTTNITGLTHFDDPVDLVEDTRNGNLYVVEYGGNRITLLKPNELGNGGGGVGAGTPKLDPKVSRVVYSDVRGGEPTAERRIAFFNTGNAPLTVSGIRLGSSGDRDQFRITQRPKGTFTIQPGKGFSVWVTFEPTGATSPGVKTASLEITSNDPASAVRRVRLRGLATTGAGGANEPSLQRVLDLYEFDINAGDNDPSDSALPIPLQAGSDAVAGQRFVKAGAGNVKITPIGVFGIESDPAINFGWYDAGTPQVRQMLFDVPTEDAQTATPRALGNNEFDPGSRSFGVVGVFPGFTESDGSLRTVYSEDHLNSFDPTNRRHVLVYPLIDRNGNTVANSYVIAFEEVPGGADFQDFVAVISNVKLATTGPELGISNIDGAPFQDRLVFNRIQRLDDDLPNVVHNTARLRVRNTGTSTLTISSTTVTGPFRIDSPTGRPINVAAGSYVDLVVRFTATSAGSGDGSYFGTLTLNTNDADEATKVIELAGFWQSQSENQQEPSLQEIGRLLGYQTSFQYTGQNLSGGGRVQTSGEEILSPYWRAADPDAPVTVQQVAAFHTQGDAVPVAWFEQGDPDDTNRIFTHHGADSQSLFPRLNTGSGQAAGRFEPGANTVFGFEVDQALSDPTLNPQEQPGGGWGHAVRFFPIRDRQGQYVADTYLMVMDYFGVNYDYNDNVYLVSNVTPANRPATPKNFTALGGNGTIKLDWADDDEGSSDLIGYYVYRSYSPTGKYERIKIPALKRSEYVDTAALAGRRAYYRVVAAGTDGSFSLPASTSGQRLA